ncbi:MAG: primosomal protein N' [Alphaproteobacteria bacterium 41-28]|nr:MAG: primosomal protein N' [Alphaproteobacteria bacterium 41-28]
MNSNSISVKISVLLPVPLDHPFDYVSDKPLAPGTLIQVPFGPRKLYGVVWNEKNPTSSKTLKPILSVFEDVRLPDVSLKFIEWVSEYTMTPRGQILKMALPAPEVFEAKGESLYGLTKPPQRLTPQRQKVLDFFGASTTPLPLAEISEKTEVSEVVLKSLLKEGVLSLKGDRPWAPPPPPPQKSPQKPQLSLDQSNAAEAIKKSLESHTFHTFLLEGVTGSGKTEVYFETIDHVLQSQGQALIMLPEIALTAQWLQRFETRFGFQPAIWHSDIKQSQKKITFRAILEGKVPVLVGARSSLFLPFPDLRLIIVDEEHDGSYKQEEGVIYNARDMGVVRARLSQATCVLASATPSLETELNVCSGKYHSLQLADRYGGAEMPDVKLIDMRKVKKASQDWISPQLREALHQTLARGEQAMLFLNRRGYAPLLLCQSCGDRLMCPQCSVSLVQHKFQDKLLCHHCGYMTRLPSTCCACQEEGSYRAIGPGVERIYEEVKMILPEARCVLMTSDQLTTAQKVSERVQQIQDHEVDILIGTQIMAKGHHFPLLTLVGIVDGDSALSGSDLRASEKSFQLLHQVSGRSGREVRKGQVLLQTHIPEHPVMQALVHQSREEFSALESDQRLIHGFPPHGRLAALIFSGKKSHDVEKIARMLAKKFPLTEKAELLGPTPAPLSFLRGQHRWRLLVKTTKDFPPQPLIKVWLSKVSLPSTVRIQIDIDPYSFL